LPEERGGNSPSSQIYHGFDEWVELTVSSEGRVKVAIASIKASHQRGPRPGSPSSERIPLNYNSNEMSYVEANVRPALANDARSIAEVHIGSWKATYTGIFPDTLLESLSIESRAW
jgi:hypothetical protein